MKNFLEKKLAEELVKQRKTICLAESCTGGLVSSRVTDVPGSSRYFTGGFITYSNSLKTDVLRVSPRAIEEHGAVSGQVAQEMARGARAIAKSDLAASITGIAGPGGETDEKPVGLAYIAFSSNRGDIVKRYVFEGDRLEIKHRMADAVLEMILENLGFSPQET